MVERRKCYYCGRKGILRTCRDDYGVMRWVCGTCYADIKYNNTY